MTYYWDEKNGIESWWEQQQGGLLQYQILYMQPDLKVLWRKRLTTPGNIDEGKRDLRICVIMAWVWDSS